jgi:hypothetical protein
MANTIDEKAEELKLPNPFQPITFAIDVNDEANNYARFVVEPLERGFGYTVGNALRRVLHQRPSGRQRVRRRNRRRPP